MKRIHLLLLGLTICLFSACHNELWEAIDGLDSRVTKLEELCKEMNTNITSLQTIVDVLQSNDFITSIVEIKKDGKVVGYTITFGKHDPITIYHGQDGKDGQNGTNGKDGQDGADGKDGKDGADGKDGQDGQNGADGKDGITPVIGVAQDTDGVYYWTLNGEWLLDDNGNKLPVSGKDGQNGTNGSNGQDGADGKDGQDGEDGKDGADGQDGKDGKDGVTPQLKIEDGYWYISYDNGATWTQLGKATGEDGEDGKDGANGTDGKDGQNGADGKDGQDGDSMFQSVTQDENYVYFTLADGTVIKIAKGSSGTEAPNPDDIIEFTDFNVRLALVELGVDTNKDGEISYVEAASVTRLDFSSHKFTSFREFKYFTNLQAVSYYNTGVREIVFPENGVDSILDNAFQGVKLKYLKITEGTKYIGTKAFYNSTIENLILPNSITVIGENAFVGCAIKSYVFPSAITYMPRGSFAECKNLETFTFPENYDGDTFLFGVELGTVPNTCPLSVVYWNVITYDKSFYMHTPDGSISRTHYGLAAVLSYHTPYTTKTYPNTNINSVIFGDKVQHIPNYLCAYLEGLTEITIPKSVTDIGEYAFKECNQLKYIYCKATTPPSRETGCFPSSIETIYVPEESVDEYKTLWGTNKIVGYNFEQESNK